MDRRTVPGSPKNFLEAISKKIQNYVFMYKKKKQKKIPEKVPVYDEEYMIPK